ncbi:hypothetical protein [Desulfosporosinus sp. BICA1-9]|uniref:hypothetical protein n=1 Tax=Desulfosporosinus sp. BICA1-9 TaxID=1531958 RepID=UPI00054BB53C|nr:hypothetical protein [Desulfosporosinus sp. BICA1-9]KJS48159.1 MAG: hypothetical protein VR66_15725 [Peptococcaceae bacterium BRH_c23]KJS78374.1 MAG: hypothetical protein JL57_31625 [Desulfosporosinus sp. BICA1-9]
MKKKLRIILVWILVSLILQFGAYSYLNMQVANVLAPKGDINEPITTQLKATIPGSNLKNIQISYAKDYLAYTENGTLKIFNLAKERIVFEKELPSAADKTLGVLTYQWLPDRDTLLYFYAKKNPNPITYVPVQPTKPVTQTPAKDPEAGVLPQDPKVEDPNEKVKKEVPKEVPVEPKLEKRYGNPQITELYTLALPNSDEDTPPDDRFNQTINTFPAGGKIEELVVSTSTNLIYLTVKNGSTELLMEIDVMKNVRQINRSGETIDDMVASDRYGTLYINSKVGGTQQVIALSGDKRIVISKNSKDRVIGLGDGKVYIGEIENNKLIRIKTTADRVDLASNPALKTEWEGSLPFNNDRTLIGSKGQVVTYDQSTAYIVTNGQLKELKLQGDENYISEDGAELIQLNRSGTSTIVELIPLKS